VFKIETAIGISPPIKNIFKNFRRFSAFFIFAATVAPQIFYKNFFIKFFSERPAAAFFLKKGNKIPVPVSGIVLRCIGTGIVWQCCIAGFFRPDVLLTVPSAGLRQSGAGGGCTGGSSAAGG
jgi:hypothetical protein